MTTSSAVAGLVAAGQILGCVDAEEPIEISGTIVIETGLSDINLTIPKKGSVVVSSAADGYVGVIDMSTFVDPTNGSAVPLQDVATKLEIPSTPESKIAVAESDDGTVDVIVVDPKSSGFSVARYIDIVTSGTENVDTTTVSNEHFANLTLTRAIPINYNFSANNISRKYRWLVQAIDTQNAAQAAMTICTADFGICNTAYGYGGALQFVGFVPDVESGACDFYLISGGYVYVMIEQIVDDYFGVGSDPTHYFEPIDDYIEAHTDKYEEEPNSLLRRDDDYVQAGTGRVISDTSADGYDDLLTIVPASEETGSCNRLELTSARVPGDLYGYDSRLLATVTDCREGGQMTVSTINANGTVDVLVVGNDRKTAYLINGPLDGQYELKDQKVKGGADHQIYQAPAGYEIDFAKILPNGLDGTSSMQIAFGLKNPEGQIDIHIIEF